MLSDNYSVSDIRALFQLAASASCETDFDELRHRFAKIHSDLEYTTTLCTKKQFCAVATDVTNAVMSVLDDDAVTSQPLTRLASPEMAARHIIREMEKGSDTPASQPYYHSYGHYLDVAIMAAAIGVVNHKMSEGRFTRNDVKDLYVAGLAHDLDHPGGGNDMEGAEPRYFELENKSVTKLMRILQNYANYSMGQQIAFTGIIRSTEPIIGAELINLRMQNILSPVKRRQPPAFDESAFANHAVPIIRTFHKSLNIRKTVEQGYILAKADLAVSLLSANNFLHQTDKFQRELIAADKLVRLIERGIPAAQPLAAFFDNVVRLMDGEFLQPAVEAVLGKSTRITRRHAYTMAGLAA